MLGGQSHLRAIVAEKPSVARDIARVVGANRSGKGFYEGGGWIVTWAIGHLVHLAEPDGIDPAWKKWRRDALPMLPSRWPLVVDESRSDQFQVVRGILSNRRVERVVCATDAGREGELIFRQIYEAAKCRKPVDRLWISSLTPSAIRGGFDRLRPSAEFDSLASAARARSRADWLVGMNFTRAYTLDYGHGSSGKSEVLSVGRVQTPTLAILVQRELAIRNFVPEDYLEVQAEFDAGKGRLYRGTYFALERGKRQTRLPIDGERAKTIVERAGIGKADIESVRRTPKRLAPPLLYDLTELQRHANRLFGFSAKRTLELAQQLYERNKAITYPRTDSRHLSSTVASQLPGIARRTARHYDPATLAQGTGERPLGRRYVDDSKVTDHHAIIPTGSNADGVAPGSDAWKILDLVQRRLLQAWHGDHKFAVTEVMTRVTHRADADQYLSRGTAVDEKGWKVLDVKPTRPSQAPKKDRDLPGGLRTGLPVKVVKAEAVKKQTRPPPRFTEATLLTAMESAGRALDSKELSDAMKERGLGTPATRAGIIETLLKRGYLERAKKQLVATDHGIRLLENVHPMVRSPELTGEWEARLREIERGAGEFGAFMEGIEQFVREVVGSNGDGTRAPAPPHRPTVSSNAPGIGVPNAPRVQAQTRPLPKPPPAPTSKGAPPKGAVAGGPPPRSASASTLRAILRDRFGHASFRPYQEEVCRHVSAGQDVLLVMPTGAGKSLCYQLPGIARGGTTLVISPLIALMEDQAEKLRQSGFRAERIHSGRDRLESRRVCEEYLAGTLDFLFIAPERLSVPGFPEMLAKRTPALVAIDEAHCISMWGHDFRPDYRRLRERLPPLRPAPVIALTATATPLVQRDIVDQLGLHRNQQCIHGFRRDNLQIEVLELAPSLRQPALARILADESRRPAIVYAGTRKTAEEQTKFLSNRFRAATYHAGLPSDERDRVQAAFLHGHLDIVVATIAFGMGIDKANVRSVIHTAMPSSLEGYYQEIGRAGRDGLPSKVVLLHSWADRKVHEFFLDRDYPEPRLLESIYRALAGRTLSLAELPNPFTNADSRLMENAIEKLWMHGGLQIDADENATQGSPSWVDSYGRQRNHKIRQIDLVTEFTRSRECRMLDLIRHFGDLEDSLNPCGQCDNCTPTTNILKTFRALTPREVEVLECVLGALRDYNRQAKGKLFRDHLEPLHTKRMEYERIVDAMVRGGLCETERDEFTNRDGERIEFERLALTSAGRTASAPYSGVELPKEAAGLSREPQMRRQRKTKGRKKDVRDSAPRKTQKLIEGTPELDETAELVAAALRAWRKGEAQRLRVPAFRILNNSTLTALADMRPATESELLEVPGIGPGIAKKRGPKLLRLIRAASR